MQIFDLNSRIRDLYAHPVGHDVIEKILLQAGISKRLVLHPLVGTLRLSFLKRLMGKRLGDGFFECLIGLLNRSPDRLALSSDNVSPADKTAPLPWWKTAVFYQIYPRSFMDGNGDGIGDLAGIESKLDYLKALGVDALWLSPIYDSPGDDNGYDIRDYTKIDPQFGTMDDFDRLLGAIHARGMRLVMDLVVNHTSDEHRWFKAALSSPDSPYRDFYFLRKKPNNWTSFFSGSAWNEYQDEGVWGLHLFSRKQMDLNWDHPPMRQEVYTMIRWWLEKGVDGFRLDVINYISKTTMPDPENELPDGHPFIGDLMGFTGIEHYFHGPRLHQYLKEMRQEAFAPYDAFSVGETPGVGMEMGKLLTDDRRGELNMIFSFDHLETPGHTRFDIYEYDLNYYKDYLIDWMEHYADSSWMSLFYDNHDNPRMVSKIDHTHRFRWELAKLLGMIQMTLKGTPFIFQGQELGMINKDFKSIEDFRDVETLNRYRELCGSSSDTDAFSRILAGSRDHARTPVQWSSAPNAGFSPVFVTPWIKNDGDEAHCNAADQEGDDRSCLTFYRRLTKLRRKTAAFTKGTITFEHKKVHDLLCYRRSFENEHYLMIFNLGKELLPLPGGRNRLIVEIAHYDLILSNYPVDPPVPGQVSGHSAEKKDNQLRAYEGRIYKMKHNGQL
ncbi:MAG: alpha-glucosidase [Lachnospiraceae bacterium]|nr:alpha-glucosidase [Lachnospiraceae bacterium]